MAAASEVVIVKPRIERAVVRIEGTSSLICHQFSERSIDKILDKQTKKGAKAREVRDPQRDFEEAAYPLGDGRYGFPAVALKQCIVSAVRFVDGLTMTVVRGAVHVQCDWLLPIVGAAPRMRRDVARLPNKAPDLRFRPEWTAWSMDVPLTVNASVLSMDQVVNLLDLGGFGVGIGELRPEQGYDHGMFQVIGINPPGEASN